MDLEFTAEQEALRDAVRDLLERECPASAVRELAEKAVQPARLWSAQVETGWSALALGEDVGGLGLGAVELALVAEEAGRAIAPGPWLATVTQYAAVLDAAAGSDQRAELLGPVCEGAVTGALALAEDSSSRLPSDFAASAQRDGATWRINGRKEVVVSAELASRLAVVAAVGDRVGVFVVDIGDVTVDPVATFDRTRPWATVTFTDAPAEPVGEPGSPAVAAAVDRGVEVATVCIAAEIVGACAAMLERTVTYAGQREQFGVPIGSFQAVKHKLADDFLAVERARAAVSYAALTIAEDDPRRALAVSMAKAAAGDCEQRVVEDSIQTHGGIGYTWEHDLQLWAKRAKQNSALFGTAAWHRSRVADLLGLPR
jgi:alkylation response protein AidB-like acyl-CoA dehydrogenase